MEPEVSLPSSQVHVSHPYPYPTSWISTKPTTGAKILLRYFEIHENGSLL